ncbi:PAS domain-containing protein [Methanogenium organophilum]|uniref:histidine kinase n=1 Tax=Methanogenium organophilum TaxID=2199 RepID=A0A9X9S7Z7_METOG|nr:PAS domain-containing protein [Methanogenium organophilum]WAI02450.1 PAS domain-containing protein [Methanogenium organophilum]
MTIIAALAIGIVVFCVFSYFSAIENIEYAFQEKQQAAEKQIAVSSNLIDRGNRIYEATFDGQLKNGLEKFRDVYMASGSNPAAIDLFSLKDEMEQYATAEVDLYIVNSAGVIEYTTYAPDMGVDFSKIPLFFQEFTRIRQGDIFVPDRSGSGVDHTRVLRKFAYLPTPDHDYVLEMSLNMEEMPHEQRIFTYDEIIADLADAHPVVTNIRFYASSFGPFNINTGIGETGADDATIAILRQVRDTGEPVVVSDRDNQTETRYISVDIEDTTSPVRSLMDFYAEVKYTTESRDMAAAQALVTYGIIMLLGLAIAALTGILVSRRISQPVTRMVDDIDIIAGGDLDHEIRSARIPELSKIADSTTILVTELKERIDEIDRKNRELALSEGEKTLILNAVAESVFYLDTDYHIIWANAAGRRITDGIDGIPEGCLCYTVVHGEEQPCDGCPIPEALVRRRPVQGTVIAADGTITEVTASPVLNDGGVPIGIVTTALDVTDREAAAEALRTSEKQYRDLFTSMNTGFALIRRYEGGDIRFLTVNPAFAEITEICSEDVSNSLVEDILPGGGKMGEEILQRINEDRAEEPVEFHSDILGKDLRIAAFATGKENEAGVLLEDITGIVELRRQQCETLEQIEQNLEHLAILNDEIRNPLMVILGYTELDEGIYADRIYEQIATINELVRRLDQRWLESEKVREFLRKHHDWKPDRSDDES